MSADAALTEKSPDLGGAWVRWSLRWEPAMQPDEPTSRTFATGHFESDKPQQKRGSQIKGLHYIGSCDRLACWVVVLGRGCSGNTNRNRSIVTVRQSRRADLI